MAARSDTLTQATVTAVMAVIATLAFTFSFGNVWALALRLGIAHPIAPLIAPMVDLSVIGLLVALRRLTLQGVPARELRPATRLMHLCGLLTLALNTAEPLTVRHYGRAALDTVAPLLLLGWGKVGPLLLGHFHTTHPEPTPPPAPAAETATPVAAPDTTAPDPSRFPAAPPPTASPAHPGPRPLPAPLIHAGRQIADAHRSEHARAITAPELAARLRITPHLATTLAAHLDG
ncbi:DUF2637 domain-containing protein [Actinacidiphila sp. bgisy145]|uniref:DUF2637 domain-containing protein n=1 Tax=Actinacidiphila sp. bgisy145 TaxID=3413792 RepID=UPI003EC03DE9